MFRPILFCAFILGAWRWSNWREWRKYYPTILYFVVNSLLYTVLFYEYPLWRFNPLDNILRTDALVSLASTFIVFPATTLIYLTHYPESKYRLLYNIGWALFYVLIEVIGRSQNAILYYHRWTLTWSALFNIVAFSLLGLHHRHPLPAWLLAAAAWALLSLYFQLP